MKLLFQLAWRNARRNVRRSVLTASTVLIGVTLLVVSLSWMEGIFGGMTALLAAESGHARVVDADFAAREALMPLYENLPAVSSLVTRLEAVEGVRAAEPRIQTGVMLSIGEELGDNFAVLTGANERYYRERLAADSAVVAGTWLSGAPEEVVLGRKIAEQIGAKPGSRLLLLGATQYGSMSDLSATVVGIVAGDSLMNSQAFVRLEDAAWMLDLEGGALEVLLYGEGHDMPSVGPWLERVRALPEASALSVTAWYERPPFDMMMGIIGAMKYLMQAVFIFITALAIFNTMTMSVLERTREIGVMRAMGLSRLGAVILFLVEALGIGLLGSIAGLGLGATGALWLEVYGVSLPEDLGEKVGTVFPMVSTFYADLTGEILLSGLITGLLIAALGAALPALRAAAIQPVSAMRARR